METRPASVSEGLGKDLNKAIEIDEKNTIENLDEMGKIPRTAYIYHDEKVKYLDDKYYDWLKEKNYPDIWESMEEHDIQLARRREVQKEAKERGWEQDAHKHGLNMAEKFIKFHYPEYELDKELSKDNKVVLTNRDKNYTTIGIRGTRFNGARYKHGLGMDFSDLVQDFEIGLGRHLEKPKSYEREMKLAASAGLAVAGIAATAKLGKWRRDKRARQFMEWEMADPGDRRSQTHRALGMFIKDWGAIDDGDGTYSPALTFGRNMTPDAQMALHEYLEDNKPTAERLREAFRVWVRTGDDADKQIFHERLANLGLEPRIQGNFLTDNLRILMKERDHIPDYTVRGRGDDQPGGAESFGDFNEKYMHEITGLYGLSGTLHKYVNYAAFLAEPLVGRRIINWMLHSIADVTGYKKEFEWEGYPGEVAKGVGIVPRPDNSLIKKEFKKDEKFYEKVKNKYPSHDIIPIGHSLGGVKSRKLAANKNLHGIHLNPAGFMYDALWDREPEKKLQKTIAVRGQVGGGLDVAGALWKNWQPGIKQTIPAKASKLDYPLKGIDTIAKAEWAASMFGGALASKSLIGLLARGFSQGIKGHEFLRKTSLGALLFQLAEGVTTHFISNFDDDSRSGVSKPSNLKSSIESQKHLDKLKYTDKDMERYLEIQQSREKTEAQKTHEMQEEELDVEREDDYAASQPDKDLEDALFYDHEQGGGRQYHASPGEGITSWGRAVSRAAKAGRRGTDHAEQRHAQRHAENKERAEAAVYKLRHKERKDKDHLPKNLPKNETLRAYEEKRARRANTRAPARRKIPSLWDWGQGPVTTRKIPVAGSETELEPKQYEMTGQDDLMGTVASQNLEDQPYIGVIQRRFENIRGNTHEQGHAVDPCDTYVDDLQLYNECQYRLRSRRW